MAVEAHVPPGSSNDVGAHCTHTVQFFEDGQYPADRIASYLLASLSEQRGAIVYSPQARVGTILHALRATGVDVSEALRRGQLITRDADDLALGIAEGGLSMHAVLDTISTRDIPGVVSRYGGARIHGEIVDVLAARGQVNDAITVEDWWNDVLSDRRLELHCAYCLSHFATDDATAPFRKICAQHSRVGPARNADGRDPQRLLAELQQVEAALRAETSVRRALEQERRVLQVAHRRAQLRAEGAAHSLENVAERARMDRERADAEARRANAAEQAKDEFLAVLGHELRNPLAPILTAVQLMALRGDDVASKERTIIERQVTRLARLVDDLLDLSRITRSKLKLRLHPVELGDVLADAVEAASPALEANSHELVVRVPAFGLTVEADRARLAQAIGNVLTNAALFTPPGGLIRVTATAGHEHVRLTIADNGIGMGPDLLARIFCPFAQGEKQGPERAQGGLGLGLTIAHSFAGMHRGSLLAASDGPGLGSTFTFELPLSARFRTGDPPPWSARCREGLSPGCRVLIVDDNTDAATALADALTHIGYAVRSAHDGPSALKLAHAFRPSVALVDIGLPVMDGYELAHRLRSLFPEAPPALVALTGYGSDADRSRAFDAGFADHLVKPVDLRSIEDVLSRLHSELR